MCEACAGHTCPPLGSTCQDSLAQQLTGGPPLPGPGWEPQPYLRSSSPIPAPLLARAAWSPATSVDTLLDFWAPSALLDPSLCSDLRPLLAHGTSCGAPGAPRVCVHSSEGREGEGPSWGGTACFPEAQGPGLRLLPGLSRLCDHGKFITHLSGHQALEGALQVPLGQRSPQDCGRGR